MAVFDLFGKSNKKEKKPLYLELRVREIVRETHDAISLIFDPPAGEKLSYKPGQFLTLILNIDGREVRRAYSLCSTPFADDYPAIAVKRVKGGLVSNWLPDHVKSGDVIKVLKPVGSFTTDYISDRKRHLVFFAGGSGITPIMGIIRSALIQEKESTMTLIYCNRDSQSIIFRDRLEKLRASNPARLKIIHVLDVAPDGWDGYTGLLNDTLLNTFLEPVMKDTAMPVSYWMCGPEGMMRIVEGYLINHGIPREAIFREYFVQSTIDRELTESAKKDESNVTRTVTIIYDGEEYKIDVEPGRYILETALDKGIDLPFSCQSGICTTCRGKALSGEVDNTGQEGLTQAEVDDGYVLTCIGRPLSDDVVIEIG